MSSPSIPPSVPRKLKCPKCAHVFRASSTPGAPLGCPECGFSSARVTPRVSASPASAAPFAIQAAESAAPRPRGVSVLALLMTLGAALLFLAFVFLLVGATDLLSKIVEPLPAGARAEVRSAFQGFVVLGAMIPSTLILALGYLVLARGFWRGRAWAWRFGVGVQLVGFAFVGASILINPAQWPAQVPPTIVGVVVVAYLMTRRVRSFFGRPAPSAA